MAKTDPGNSGRRAAKSGDDLKEVVSQTPTIEDLAEQAHAARLAPADWTRRVLNHQYGVTIIGGTVSAVLAAAIIGGCSYLMIDERSDVTAPDPKASASSSNSTDLPSSSDAPDTGFTFGQMSAGDLVRAKVNDGEFRNAPPAKVGDTVTFAMRLSNGGPKTITGLRVVAVPLSTSPDTFASFDMQATADNMRADEVISDDASVTFDTPACASYVQGSTEGYRADGAGRRRLPDGVVDGGIPLPHLDVGIDDTFFVSFKLQIGSAVEC